MVIEFGGLEVDLSAVREAIAERGKTSPTIYTVEIAAHDPPPGYAAGPSRHGGIEIALPRIPVPEALLTLALLLLMLAWPVGWLHEGHVVFAALGALGFAYYVAWLAAGVFVQTSWVVADHWLLRRRVLWGLPAWETEFAVDFIEIDNAQWKTGRGSTDTVRLQSPPPASERVKIHTIYDKVELRSPQPRLAADVGEGPISENVLQLGRFLAYYANVPLEVVVRLVSEPD